jgi:hypothetical protein
MSHPTVQIQFQAHVLIFPLVDALFAYHSVKSFLIYYDPIVHVVADISQHFLHSIERDQIFPPSWFQHCYRHPTYHLNHSQYHHLPIHQPTNKLPRHPPIHLRARHRPIRNPTTLPTQLQISLSPTQIDFNDDSPVKETPIYYSP